VPEEVTITDSLRNWTLNIIANETGTTGFEKLILFFYSMLAHSLRQFERRYIPVESVVNTVTTLVSLTLKYREDRAGGGLLGLIGLGDKSQLSVRVRLFMRALHLFLYSRRTDNNQLVFRGQFHSTPLVDQHIKQLMQLNSSKEYTQYQEVIASTRQFVLDSSRGIEDAPEFVSLLLHKMFNDVKILNALSFSQSVRR
jgi:hypothetical protein